MSGNDSVIFNRLDANSENDDVWDDAALIKMYDKTKAVTYDKLQNSGPSSTSTKANTTSSRQWKVNDLCMAPFAEDGKYYPAKITKVLDKSKTCEVVYTEYDTTATVKLTDLLSGQKRAHPTSTSEPNAQLPVPKKMCVVAEAPSLINFYEDTVLDDIKLFSDTQSPEIRPKIAKSEPKIVVRQQKSTYYACCSLEKVQYLAKASTFQAKIYCLKNNPKLLKLDKFTPIPSACLTDYDAGTVTGLKQKACAVNLYSEEIHERLGAEIPGATGYNLDLSEDDVEYADDSTTDNGQVAQASTSSGQQQIFPVPELCPPPPPNLFGQIAQAGNDKEALTNMLMSWYMSGYHTGYFQGLQQGKKKQGGKGGDTQ